MVQIHVSDVKTFKTCPQRWYWSSHLRHNLEPTRPYMPFFLGRIIHESLDQYYTDGIDLLTALEDAVTKELTKEIKALPEYLETLELANEMLTQYSRWVRNPIYKMSPWHDSNLEWLASEIDFNVPLYNPKGKKSNKVSFSGRVDGIVKRKDTGELWIVEHKTAKNFNRIVKLYSHDIQPAAYIYAIQQLVDEPIVGVMYNMLRKKAPVTPPTLKNGQLSRSKSVDTSIEHYVHCAKEAVGNIPNAMNEVMRIYGEHLKHLKDNKAEAYNMRFFLRKNKYEVRNMGLELWQIGLAMARETTLIYPVEGYNCPNCVFYTPCSQKKQGINPAVSLTVDYKKREPYRPVDNKPLPWR